MGRRRSSRAGGEALVALVAVTIAALVAVTIAVGKAAVAVTRWVAETFDDLHSDDDVRRLRGRVRVATVASALLVVAGLWAGEAYGARTPWHRQYAAGLAPFALGVAAVVAALAFAIWRALTGARLLRRVPAASAWVAGALGGLVCVVTTAVDQPGLAGARAALTRGDVTRARVEALALWEQGGSDRAASGAILDQLHDQDIEHAETPAHAAGLLSERWYSDAARARAEGDVIRRIEDAADRAAVARDVPRLDALVAVARGHSLPSRSRVEVLRTLARADLACTASSEPSCSDQSIASARATSLAPDHVARVTQRCTEAANERLAARVREASTTDDPERREGAWREARAAADCVRALTGREPAPPRAEIEQHLTAATRDAERARERRRREEARRERAEEARARRESRRSGNVMCCDGTVSPTCGCARASFRGCCSHHGGICGGCGD